MSTGVVVRTRAGRVRGSLGFHGVAAFRGIPYAAAPVGPLRFEGPQPVRPWRGVRPAINPGPTPLRGVPNASGAIPTDTVPGDEVLNLSVYTPRPGDADAGLPVLVWIHGGAYHEGSASRPLYDMTEFAHEGVIGVVLNYRLGFDGFGFVDGVPPNRGILDWLAALEWVQENIAAFGGDPRRVTIAGQSSGGSAVLRLLTLPAARGLFQGAIAQSPAELDLSKEVAIEITADLATHLGIRPDRAGFEKLEVGAVQSAQYRAIPSAKTTAAHWVRAAGLGTTLRYMPVIDGALVQSRMLDDSRGGVGHDLPLLIGAVTNDQRAGTVPRRVHPPRCPRGSLRGPGRNGSRVLPLAPARR